MKYIHLQVIRELFDQKGAVNALLADAHKFAHPLKHLGKTENDLPVLAIDSFQHMFLFHDMNELDKPGKLREVMLLLVTIHIIQGKTFYLESCHLGMGIVLRSHEF